MPPLAFAYHTLKSIAYCAISGFMVMSAEARAAARFVVAERGAPPRTAIWCSDAGVEVEKHAANELRDYVRRITGVELPVSLESKRPSGRVIQLSSGEFEDDGFELAVKGETLRVRGGRRAGVLYGVYALTAVSLKIRCAFTYSSHRSVPRNSTMRMMISTQYTAPQT